MKLSDYHFTNIIFSADPIDDVQISTTTPTTTTHKKINESIPRETTTPDPGESTKSPPQQNHTYYRKVKIPVNVAFC